MSLKVLMLFVDKTSLELVYLKQQKKNFKKKVVCLKRKFHVREKKKKKLFQNKFCVGLRSIDVTFLLWTIRCVCVQQNVMFFFLLKSENYLVPNSKGTSFLELRVFPVRSDLITWYFIMCFV